MTDAALHSAASNSRQSRESKWSAGGWRLPLQIWLWIS